MLNKGSGPRPTDEEIKGVTMMHENILKKLNDDEKNIENLQSAERKNTEDKGKRKNVLADWKDLKAILNQA